MSNAKRAFPAGGVRRRRCVPLLAGLSVIGLISLVTGGPAVAASGPVIGSASAVVLEDGIRVTGAATFDLSGSAVATDVSGDAVVQGIGADLTSATITPLDDDIRFTLGIADSMAGVGAPPETLHYNWEFSVYDGVVGHEFELQALRTSTLQEVRDTQVPGGAPVFRILACTTNATGGRSCSQLSRVPGELTSSSLQFTVPMATIGAGPGTRLTAGRYGPNASVGVSGAAWYSDGTGGDAMELPDSYALGTVAVSAVPVGAPPGSFSPIAVSADGSFDATVPLPATSGAHTVTVRACHRTEPCSFASIPVTIPVPPPVEEWDPILDAQPVWFHCNEDARVGNVAAAGGEAAPWSPVPPDGAVSDGDGCASADPPARNTVTQISPLDAVWAGTVDGNIDSMTVRAYLRGVDGQGDQTTMTVMPRVSIDGVVRLGPVAQSVVDVAPLAGSVPGTSVVEFSVTNLGFTSEADHGRSHDVIFSLDSYHLAQNAVWLWDAAEIASGIVFNPAAPAAAVVRAPGP